jgi:hypothetical protein
VPAGAGAEPDSRDQSCPSTADEPVRGGERSLSGHSQELRSLSIKGRWEIIIPASN